METTSQNSNTPTRVIPPLPGGGSWTFDEASWKWMSNDPIPQPAAEQSAATEQPAAEE